MKKILFFLVVSIPFMMRAQFNNATIVAQPQDQTDLCANNYVLFNVVALNADSYQWQESSDGGATWTDVSDDIIHIGSTNDSLWVFASSSVDSFLYRCYVTNNNSSDTSDAAILTLETNPPVFSGHDGVVYLGALSSTTLNFYDYVDTVYEDCQPVTTSTSPQQVDCSNIGDSVQVVLMATDANGNTGYDTIKVWVVDTVPPTGMANPLAMAYINDSGTATIDPTSLLIYASDNCEVTDTIVLDTTEYSCSDVGTTQNVRIVLVDTYGNTDTLTVPVMIMDTIAPEVQCVNDTVITLPPGDTVYTVQGTMFDATATDNCGIMTITNNYNSSSSLDGAQFYEGTTQVMWTAYDNGGMSSFCTFNITINVVTDVDENTVKTIEVYPNPASNIINITNLSSNAIVGIYNIAGVKEKVKMIKQNGIVKVDITNLHSGIYFLRIKDKNHTETRKITKL